MKFRPPQHRIDTPIVFIHPADEAWDKEAIEASAKEHGDECPHARYHSGDTRFDVGDVQGFLSGKPVEYHLARLSALQLNEVQGLYERDLTQGSPMTRTAYLQAARYGLQEIKQGGSEILKLKSPGNMTVGDIESIAEATELGIDLLRTIGQATHLASQPLRDDEKKH